jgi:hypothetical protein
MGTQDNMEIKDFFLFFFLSFKFYIFKIKKAVRVFHYYTSKIYMFLVFLIWMI